MSFELNKYILDNIDECKYQVISNVKDGIRDYFTEDGQNKVMYFLYTDYLYTDEFITMKEEIYKKLIDCLNFTNSNYKYAASLFFKKFSEKIIKNIQSKTLQLVLKMFPEDHEKHVFENCKQTFIYITMKAQEEINKIMFDDVIIQ